MFPLLFLLFLIETFNPISWMIDCSRALRFISFEELKDCFLILKIFTKFSDCLTESFFSIILFATNSAFLTLLKF